MCPGKDAVRNEAGILPPPLSIQPECGIDIAISNLHKDGAFIIQRMIGGMPNNDFFCRAHAAAPLSFWARNRRT